MNGLANGIMVPYVMDFNQSAVPEKFKILADTVGADDLGTWLRELKADIGIPEKLSAAGVEDKHLDALVGTAVKDVCHALNPKPVADKDFRRLFESALN